MTQQTFAQRGKWKQWLSQPRIRGALTVGAYGLGGFFMSAASLGGYCQPLAMGLICAVTGWRAVVMALGSVLGYLFLWGIAGQQGMLWAAGGCLIALFLGKKRMVQEAPLLIPAVAAFWVSVSGLAFQVLMADQTPVPIFFLRVALAGAGARLYGLVWQRGSELADQIGLGTAVLALSQVVVFPGFSLGYPAAGMIGAAGAFPAAALAGLALDLAQVTDIPMTGVLSLAFFLRLLPVEKKWIRYCAPGAAYLIVMLLCGGQELLPLLGIGVGGAIGAVLPGTGDRVHRRGETGMAQVRLEIMAGVLSQTQQLLLEVPVHPIDEDALLARTRERACGNCPQRKTCTESAQLPTSLLHIRLTDTGSLGIPCKKPGRLLTELRRSQEQLRALRGERERQWEQRQAVVQQYQFLSEYLRQQSDGLGKRGQRISVCFQVETEILSYGKEAANGDKCQCFEGTGGNYYVALCDGMGTGMGAAQDGQTAITMLRRMLTAGFPAEYALRSLNSLCCLRGRAGAVTVDLAQIHLNTGKVDLYKWGAAPSWLLREGMAEKIGTAGPPPGFSVSQTRETVDRLSLRRGEVLILMSDGVDGEGVLGRQGIAPGEPLGETAARLLEWGSEDDADDATVAAIRLHPTNLST